MLDRIIIILLIISFLACIYITGMDYEYILDKDILPKKGSYAFVKQEENCFTYVERWEEIYFTVCRNDDGSRYIQSNK